jgi:hypothetical protein
MPNRRNGRINAPGRLCPLARDLHTVLRAYLFDTTVRPSPALLANNLIIIGELLTKRSRRRRKTKRQFLS